jgi:shikimate dehydrogenase
MQNRVFGLIGNPIKHSFSKTYFENKFSSLHYNNCRYELFELKCIEDLSILLKKEKDLQGLNVTSPYKIQILNYLDSISEDAKEIGAVNTIKIQNNKLIGYNTDWIGFLLSLKNETDIKNIHSTLILGTSGAAKAVGYALKSQNIKHLYVTRKDSLVDLGIDPNSNNPNTYSNHIDTLANGSTISYKQLNRMENFSIFDLIINATPCGMATYPPIADIDTNKITPSQIVFDLIYNPSQTLLLKTAKEKGCRTINGLQMLYNQADASWNIWSNN